MTHTRQNTNPPKPPNAPISDFIDAVCAAYEHAQADADSLDRHGYSVQAAMIRRVMEPIGIAVLRLSHATRTGDDHPIPARKDS